MQDQIKDDIINWSDMEEAFGRFTKEIKTIEDLQDFHEFLSLELQDYLQEQLNDFNPSKWHYESISKGMLEFLTFLDRSEQNSIKNYLGADSYFSINIVSFNYTKTIEKILEFEAKEHISMLKSHLNRIEHVHGVLGDTIVLGVDNTTQIANEKFKDDAVAKDYLVKTQCNEGLKSDNTRQCESLISSADIIVLYGVSLGETDSHWWKYIGNLLLHPASKCLLIDFEYVQGKPWDPKRKNRLTQVERNLKNRLYEKLGLMDEDPVERKEIINMLKDRIFIQVDKLLFSSVKENLPIPL